MVIISPTTSSGLSEAYSVMLPDFDINIEAPKAVQAVKTISGGGVVSVFGGNIAGEEREVARTVTSAQYTDLVTIIDTEVEEWILRIRGRIFKVVLNLVSAKPNLEVKDMYDITLELTFTEELTGL